MAEDSEEEVREALESQIHRYGLITQTKIEQAEVDTDLTMDELLVLTDGILEEDDIPEEGRSVIPISAVLYG